MEDHLGSMAASHLLPHSLRSLCIHGDSPWIYAIFWRILPRNYPPPQWDLHADGSLDRSRGNRRNWILAWEDGFCNFSVHRMKPELFFKMSHEIYSYGEGLIGKVAETRSHKWVFKDSQMQESGQLHSWNNPGESHPRTWEPQFLAGIETIVLVAVKEGVIQLGAINKIPEDPSLVHRLRSAFSYLDTIPGVLLPHPSSAALPPPIPRRHVNVPFSALRSLLSSLPAVDLGDADYRSIAASPEIDGPEFSFY